MFKFNKKTKLKNPLKNTAFTPNKISNQAPSLTENGNRSLSENPSLSQKAEVINITTQTSATAIPGQSIEKVCDQPTISTVPAPADLTTESSLPNETPKENSSPTPSVEETTEIEELLQISSTQWFSQYETVVGLAHRDAHMPLPCQDAAFATEKPRPILLIADGAGSSAVSDIGSQTVITALKRFLDTIDRQVADILDNAQIGHPDQAKHLALLLVKHAKGVLDDLAILHRRPQKDFRCTLLAVIVGKKNTLWLKIGDGAIIIEKMLGIKKLPASAPTYTPIREVLGHAGKGEYANQTTFIDANLLPADVQTGVISTLEITGISAMTDGVADKIVSLRGDNISGQISEWLDDIRNSRLKRRSIIKKFYSDEFTRQASGDDCGIALIARSLP